MNNDAVSYLNGNLTELNANNNIVKNKNIAMANKVKPKTNSGLNSVGSSGQNKGVSNIAVNGAGVTN